VKRRAFALALALMPVALSVRAQASTATQLQIDLTLAFISLAALRTRYGDGHPELVTARARVDSLTAGLRAAIARHETLDIAVVTQTLDGELADVRARLAEFSQRCGSGHPDMQSAHVRAAALENAIAHITSDGIFFPPLDAL
jgi:uncharacterized protein involved in exopolysaccharide biosynthesis